MTEVNQIMPLTYVLLLAFCIAKYVSYILAAFDVQARFGRSAQLAQSADLTQTAVEVVVNQTADLLGLPNK